METFTVRDVSFTYPGRSLPAIEDIGFTIDHGEFVCLCGRSGCGKSTLLRNLKTVLAPKGMLRGDIRFYGTPLAQVEERQQARRIGYVLQNPDNQIVTDKVWHELAFGLENLGMDNKTIRVRVAEMASFFGIQTWFHKKVSELSGGQKQLLNLAAVMVMQPDVLILDEPTSQLDPIAASDFLETVKKVNREIGTTVLITEHRLEEVLPMADRVLVMDEGRILVDDTPERVGAILSAMHHDMFVAMPSPLQTYAMLYDRGLGHDLPCPLDVQQGREFLTKLLAGEELTLTRLPDKREDEKQETEVESELLPSREETEVESELLPSWEESELESKFPSNREDAEVKSEQPSNAKSLLSADMEWDSTAKQKCELAKGNPTTPKVTIAEAKSGQLSNAKTPQSTDEEWKSTAEQKGALAKDNSVTPKVIMNEVWFRYEKNGDDVIKDLSVKIYQGELFAVVGGNGTGKTTMLTLMSGINKPYRGKITLDGKPIGKYKDKELFTGKLGVLPQNPQAIFVEKTVEKDLYEMLEGRDFAEIKKNAGNPVAAAKAVEEEKRQRVKEAAELVDITHLLPYHPYDLSGGEQQRAALAKILLMEPELLLLDEPTKGIDNHFKEKLAEIFAALKNKGVTILMVSHDIEFCGRFADRCAMFFDGAITTINTPRTFFSGNSFYTTAANRMSRHIFENAVTAKDVAALCLVNMQEANLQEFGSEEGEGPLRGAGSEEGEDRLQESGSDGGEHSNLPDSLIDNASGDTDKTEQDSDSPGDTDKTEKDSDSPGGTDKGATPPPSSDSTAKGAPSSDFAQEDSQIKTPEDQGETDEKVIGSDKSVVVQAAQKANFSLAAAQNRDPDDYETIRFRVQEHRLRDAIISILFIALMGAACYVGTKILGDRSFYPISFLMVLLMQVPFFVSFERRKLQAREIMVLAVLITIGVVGRMAFFMLPQISPVLAVAILAGATLGANSGFIVGAFIAFVSNFVFGQGPWTPWQMLAMGVVGFLAGMFFCRQDELGAWIEPKKIPVLVYGALSGFIYGLIVDVWTIFVIDSSPTWATVLTVYGSGFLFNAVLSGGTFLFLLLLFKPMVEKIERIKNKYGLLEIYA